MTHDELIDSLAGHLLAPDRMVWRDMQLGAVGSPRPDVYTMLKSYAHPMAMAYECKVSRSDFRSDVTTGKWQSYLRFAGGVYFAAEAGLVDKREVPEHCGLMVLTNSRWRAAKKPVVNAGWELPREAWLKLLIDGVERQGANAIRHRAIQDWAHSTSLDKRHGEIVAKTIRDRLAVEREIESAKQQADRIVADARRSADWMRKEAGQTEAAIPGLRSQLCNALGLPAESDHHAIRRAVSQIRESLQHHPLEARFEQLTAEIRRSLDRCGYQSADSAKGQE